MAQPKLPSALPFSPRRRSNRACLQVLLPCAHECAWNNALFYVKGGAAASDNQYTISDIPSGALIDTANESRWGGTVGVGFEYGFGPNSSFAFEYDHMFMGSREVNFNVVGGGFGGTDHINQDVDLSSARFKFGGPVVARY